MTKQTSAASAASFLGTKADKPATAPKSRKPSTKSTVAVPATASVAAQLVAAAPQIAAQAAEKPAKRTAPDLKLVIVKAFRPRTNQLVSKKADGHGNFAQENNWDALVKAIQAHGGAISYADAVLAVEAAGKAGGYEATCNARGFVQGRVRNGHVKAA